MNPFSDYSRSHKGRDRINPANSELHIVLSVGIPRNRPEPDFSTRRLYSRFFDEEFAHLRSLYQGGGDMGKRNFELGSGSKDARAGGNCRFDN